MIEISVLSEYMPSHSSDEKSKYLFSYSVTIKNESDINVQLISRHWQIVNSNGNIKTVNGIGVIGEQPVIYPGDNFTYTSATEIDTPKGEMFGTYAMETEFGERFDAEIPKFNLIIPRSLH